MALATDVLLGVGNTAEVYAVSATEAAWLPYDWADFARFTVTLSQLNLAGFKVRIGAVWHEDLLRSCAFYPRATGASLAEEAPVDPQGAIEFVQGSAAAMTRVGLSFVHYEPKHILRYNDTYMLTGLSHAYDSARPPNPHVREWGPFSPIGDSPLCFWSSSTLEQPDVTRFLCMHALSVCCSLLADRKSTDITATAAYSSTAAQIKLSLTDPNDDPDSVAAVIKAISAMPKHGRAPQHVIDKGLAALRLNARCCPCFGI